MARIAKELFGGFSRKMYLCNVKCLFAGDEYKFAVQEHIFKDYEHKFTGYEYKIDIVYGKFRFTGTSR